MVDAFDPALIEAVNFPVLQGITMSDFQSILETLEYVQILGVDVVEYNSFLDSDNLRSACAISEIILGVLSVLGDK